MTLQQAREFYESQLGVQGWLPHEVGRSLNEEAIWLPFFLGQRDLLVGLVKLANGRTRVRVGDELERSSWQLSLPGADEPKTRPERKTAMSYESWLRLNRHPAGLELLDTYQKEMQAVLKKSPTTVPKD